MEKETRLTRSECKVMDILWQCPGICAGDAAREAARLFGWNKNTTYTLLKNLAAKGAIAREEPGFRCVPLVSRDEIRQSELRDLAQRLFGGDLAALAGAAFALSPSGALHPAPQEESSGKMAQAAPSRGRRLH
ncbi:MAG: BlaI/MecI/CopY family transcriptional regulator [Oscillospiraceae bacterium]|nr:BlaI/MecI/CopY family transcriptional regulator [Oscillospiraceae bacterium]